jgi:hypothetical protein
MRYSKSNCGSVLIVALIFAAILAIAVTSYLKLSVTAGQLSNRSFHMNAAQNLVDIGLERALWSLNNADSYAAGVNWTTGGFAEITGTTPKQYRGTFPSTGTYYPLSGGAEGQVKVWVSVSNYAVTTPPMKEGDYIWQAVAQATVNLKDGTKVSKMAKAYLEQRSYSDRGMVAREGMSFNGAVIMDSWKSRGSPYNLATDITYSTSVRQTNATIASPALINLQNADVYGYVSIGTSTINSSGLDVGPSGRIRGVFPPGAGSGPGVDTTRVTCDFNASFPDVKPAEVGTPGTAIDAAAGGTTISTSGVTVTGAPATGTTITSGTYTIPSIDLNGAGADIHIGSNSTISEVILTVTGNVSLNGGATIYIYPHPTNPALRGSSLKLYVGGNIAMGGGSGIQNGTATVPNNPDCFTLLGLRTELEIAGGASMQNWEVRGNGYLSCVIFAPNANVQVVGNSDTYGSLVGNRVDIVGTGAFHQDESLENNKISSLWKLLKWRELYTAADRALYATDMNF